MSTLIYMLLILLVAATQNGHSIPKFRTNSSTVNCQYYIETISETGTIWGAGIDCYDYGNSGQIEDVLPRLNFTLTEYGKETDKKYTFSKIAKSSEADIIFLDLDGIENLTITSDSLRLLPKVTLIKLSGPPTGSKLGHLTIGSKAFSFADDYALHLRKFVLHTDKTSFQSPKKLQSLVINECDLQNTFTDTFVEITDLLFLILANNRISKVEPGATKGLTKLRELDLSANNITTLPDDLFSNKSEMMKIKLSNNSLTKINSALFRGLTKVDEIDLSNNQIATIEPGAFQDLTDLILLNLQGNKIKKLPDGLFHKGQKVDIRSHFDKNDLYIHEFSEFVIVMI